MNKIFYFTQEKERKRAKEKAEKERLRKEKEEEKKKKDEEREAEKKKKEEEKKKKEEEKEAEKKRKEEEKKKKEEEKEAEKKRKEEEKKRKEEEKENDKKKKEDEERRKKERLSQVFTNFFTQKKTTPAKNEDQPSLNTSLTCILAFPPFQVSFHSKDLFLLCFILFPGVDQFVFPFFLSIFQIKENMKLAPAVRTEFDSPRKEYLEHILQKSKPTNQSNLLQYRENRGRSCGATWPLCNKYNDVEVIGK